MFTLLSIQQTAGGTTENPTGTAVRCIILADNTTDPLPGSGLMSPGFLYISLSCPAQ